MKRELLVGLVLAAILVGPAAVGGGLAGSGGAEVYGHAWVQWWAAQGWPAWPVGTSLAEGTRDWAVIDPLPTWIVAGVARLVGSTAAWNLWAAAGVVLAAVGGGALARSAGGSGIYGAVGVATMPIFLGSLTSGLTEDYALGLVALGLAGMVSGTTRGRLLGGAVLGLSAWFGLYLAWMGAWAALAIGVWSVVRGGGGADAGGVVTASARRAFGPRVRSLGVWTLAALVAFALAAPAAAPFRARLAGQGHRAGNVVPRAEPLWKLDPWRGADLASFVAPGKVDVGGAFVREHPVYLGYTTLTLAAAGGAHPAWLGVLACAAVAPGEHLSWMGQPLSVDNPAIRLFRLLPFAERFNHHARVMLLGQLVLVVLASRGVQRLADRLAAGRSSGALRAPVLFTLITLAETTLLSPARLPLPTASDDLPAIYAKIADLPDLPVVVIGAAGPGIHPQRVFFDQRAHGRRLLHNPNRPMDGAIGDGRIVVALGGAVARVTTQLGAPTVAAADGAAWVREGSPSR